mgnify:CR=1 FL=1
MATPHELGFFQPAEWAPHQGTFLAWPSAADLWKDALKEAQDGVTALAEGIADLDPATGFCRGERLFVLVPDEAREAEARAALVTPGVAVSVTSLASMFRRERKPSARVTSSAQLLPWRAPISSRRAWALRGVVAPPRQAEKSTTP